MIRVLVVDDSPVARQMLTELLNSDSEIDVIGTASNGREGLEMAERLRPDLITMDIMMPEMDGFQATKQIMINCPAPIVIVSASTAVHEVATGMRALRAGALTLKLKPDGPQSPNFEQSKRELVEIVKAMAEVKVVRHHTLRKPRQRAERRIEQEVSSLVECKALGIATSTGGPPALQTILGSLPPDFPVPILIVQHIAEGFTDGFAKWLDSVVGLKVKIGEAGEPLKPGTAYVAPQDRHMGVSRRGMIDLSNFPPIGGFRPSGSFLFDSISLAFGNRAVGAILTGMGRDGVAGLRSIRESGGLTIAQDEASCVVFGMPGVAVDEGIIDTVLPLADIAQYLLDLIVNQTTT